MEFMNFDDYQQASLKFLPKDIAFSPLISKKAMCIMGIIGESKELFNVLNSIHIAPIAEFKLNIIKEIGDVSWYSVILMYLYNITPEEVYRMRDDEQSIKDGIGYDEILKISSDIVMTAASFCEEMKKVIFHKHDLNGENFMWFFGKIFNYLDKICQVFEINWYFIMEVNYNKLFARYGDEGLTEENSQGRIEYKKL